VEGRDSNVSPSEYNSEALLCLASVYRLALRSIAICCSVVYTHLNVVDTDSKPLHIEFEQIGAECAVQCFVRIIHILVRYFPI
jgi:hypothetical protein